MAEDLKAIYKILKYLREAMNYEEADIDFISANALGISENLWISIAEMLTRSGYITGIEVKYGAQGERVLSISNLRITLKGIEYLEENSLMRRAAYIAKGIKDIIPGM